jgi:hypothetical protein
MSETPRPVTPLQRAHARAQAIYEELAQPGSEPITDLAYVARVLDLEVEELGEAAGMFTESTLDGLTQAKSAVNPRELFAGIFVSQLLLGFLYAQERGRGNVILPPGATT